MKKAIVDGMSEKFKDNWLFITGDLGFNALEELEQKIGDKFINGGIAEQNMITVAAALAHEGFVPWVYSISPFITLRPYEQIRNDVCLHKLPVKIIGMGAGFGYGIMGATHHNIEDIAVMRVLPNMITYIPFADSDVSDVVEIMGNDKNPNYLRLNVGANIKYDLPKFAQWRKIKEGSKGVVVGTGPVVGNLLNQAICDDLEVWIIGILPIHELPTELIESVNKTQKLITMEEHSGQCSLRESLSFLIMNHLKGAIKIESLFASGYVSGTYGNQLFHQSENNLAGEGLSRKVEKFLMV